MITLHMSDLVVVLVILILTIRWFQITRIDIYLPTSLEKKYVKIKNWKIE